MSLFTRASAQPDRTADELARLGTRLDAVASLLLRHIDGQAAIPQQVWERVVLEAHNASAAAVAAAGATIRRKLLEHLSKWAWRVGLAYLGLHALGWINFFATGLHLGAGTGSAP